MKKAKLLVAAAAISAVPLAAAATPTLASAPNHHAAAASVPCPPGDLCLYHQPNYQGEPFKVAKCGRANRRKIIWSGIGSWINNQTPGVVGTFYDYHANVWSRTGPAPSRQPRQNWTPIWAVQPC